MSENEPTPRPRKRRLRWSQFGLRTLMLFTLAAAVASWWYTQPEWLTTPHAGGALTIHEQVRRDDEDLPIRDGRWIVHDEADRRRAAGHYAGETPRGSWTYYHAAGQPALSGKVAAGRPEGEWIARHADGLPWIVAHYEQGALSGEYREFHANGQLQASGQYADGRREGLWTRYDESGRKREEGTYSVDREEGTWRFWDDAGNELASREYGAGRELPEASAAIARWIDKLRSADAAAQGEAAWALSRVGRESVPPLRTLLREGATAERARAAATLGMLRGEATAAVDDLAAAVTDDEDSAVRCAAAVALGQIGPAAKSAAPVLERLAASDLPGMADAAQGALAAIEPENGAHIRALLARHPPAEAPAVVSYDEHDEDLAVPLTPGDAAWLAGLDGREFYRRQPGLAAALAEVLDGPNERLAVAAARALGAIGARSETSFPALQAALVDSPAAVRIAAVQALGEFPSWDQDVREVLERVAEEDADADVRNAAEEASAKQSPSVNGIGY